MPVLERSALADSPLADLHAIASELGIDGFRRLRKEELIDAIVARQGGGADASAAATDEQEVPARSRRRRGGRGRARQEEPEAAAEPEERPVRRERARREREEARPARAARDEEERTAEGVVELSENGSGFLRLGKDGAPSDDDVYVSAAQVRRCELVDGDRVSGPVRPPRRSERYPSLVRVEAINGRPAEDVAEGVRFDELPAAFPSERLAFEAPDPAVQAVEFLTPIGRGSRVTIVGAAHTGKSETLRRLAQAFVGLGDAELETAAVLAGARPEEIAEWREGPLEPVAALSFAAPADAQAQAVERAVEHGKRVAARGGHAVVLIDSLEGLPSGAARKALAAARNIPGGGSLTVIATAPEPVGGETT